MSETDNWIQMVEGIRRRTLVSGPQMMQMAAKLDKGSNLPEHEHPHEQITYVVQGKLHFFLAGTLHALSSGESLLIPGNVPHAVEVLEDTLVIDTFSPPREDLLEQDRAHAGG
ncbi:MAG: cupin domain-containing protein [Chloroflexi bacterium AL-W]|nr:cupin domain-containing protein [Chloroflexi bacterium AL-N1]NOK67914.1 cupin domain-containing protein [Chloroflexi bacterium AL-N10]NOK73254.1 cupin domain-containing protein [Chloroflexi bacterium AL-N5]NOK83168.1 cupin domain-containing protein [Chloroflexi bacterium AL-W]NOK87585.1 cupin domain-containing protein [Chloroflexi bacterium AL-N15]